MPNSTWRPLTADVTDEQWALISDLFVTKGDYGSNMGRPRKWDHRDLVEAIFFVLVTGCSWRNLPDQYPHWNTVHRYHTTWSRDRTWEGVSDRLAALERTRQGRDPSASGAVIDARSVKSASTVCGLTRGYDAGKKIVGRKLFAVVDTIGL